MFKRIPEGLHAVTEGKTISLSTKIRVSITLLQQKVHLFPLAVPNGLQDLSFLTRDLSHAPAVEAQSPNHWASRGVPKAAFLDALAIWQYSQIFYSSYLNLSSPPTGTSSTESQDKLYSNQKLEASRGKSASLAKPSILVTPVTSAPSLPEPL